MIGFIKQAAGKTDPRMKDLFEQHRLGKISRAELNEKLKGLGAKVKSAPAPEPRRPESTSRAPKPKSGPIPPKHGPLMVVPQPKKRWAEEAAPGVGRRRGTPRPAPATISKLRKYGPAAAAAAAIGGLGYLAYRSHKKQKEKIEGMFRKGQEELAKEGSVKTAMLEGFFDELEKIAQGGTLRQQMAMSSQGAASIADFASRGGAGGGGADAGAGAAAAAPPPPPPPTPPPPSPGGGAAGGSAPPPMAPSPSSAGGDIPGGLGAGDIPGGGSPIEAPKPPAPTPMSATPPAESFGPGNAPASGPATAASNVAASKAGLSQASSAIGGGFQPGKAKSLSASDLGI